MKKNIMLLFLLMTALVAAGCGMFSGGDSQEDPQPGDTIVPPEPEGERVEITLYFANNEYVQTGNEDLEKLLSEKRNVTLTNKPLAQTAVEELIRGPRGENMGVAIPSRIKLIDVETADDVAYVNFASSGMNGGSMEEYFLVYSVIKTLTELDNIEAVQFLVDGQKTETLMGHIYVMDPIGINDF